MRHESALERTHRNLPPPWDRIFSLGTRVLVWGLLFGVLYILRPFFLLIFLTFVFAYIQAHGVDGLQHRIKNRPTRVVLVALVFLGFIGAVGYFLAPQLAEQVQEFARDYPKHARALNNTVRGLGETLHLPKKQSEQLKSFEIEDVLADLIGFGSAEPDAADSKVGDAKPHPGDDSGGSAETAPAPTPTDRAANRAAVRKTIEKLQGIAGNLLGIGSSFLLSLLFSFLIVLDLPKLTRAVQNLRHTKIGFIYEEAAENIKDFGRVLGTALEAQLFIAIANTILTATGLWLMGLPSLVFLSTIVFFCSFIPVAGVFISSTPICLVALQVQPNGGVKLMMVAIGLILLIHMIEAYFLNPKIFGHHFRMNAVLVLIVLTAGGKLFGVWGLVLGLPVVNYFFAHAIRYRNDQRDAEPGPPTPASVAS
ncbi:MAG: AI-2E family transporter [Planctomycetota bacterium]